MPMKAEQLCFNVDRVLDENHLFMFSFRAIDPSGDSGYVGTVVTDDSTLKDRIGNLWNEYCETHGEDEQFFDEFMAWLCKNHNCSTFKSLETVNFAI